MNKKATLFVFFLLVSSNLIVAKPVSSSIGTVENTWETKAPMHQARTELGVAEVEGRIYAIGGCNESGSAPSLYGSIVSSLFENGVNTNEEYDPATNTWTYMAPIPTPRLAFGTTVYKNKIYCIGGVFNGSSTGINEVYDPQIDTWETKAPMPTARMWVTANAVNGKIYVMGGFPNANSSSSQNYESLNEVYDPESDSWETKAPPPKNPTFGFAMVSCVFDDKIFLIGGLSQDYHNYNQIYDPKNDTWSFGAYPPSSVGGGGAAATTGAFALKRIYALGQPHLFREGAPVYTNRVYDSKTDMWTAAADMPSKRFHFGITVLNDTLYVIGGHTYYSPLGGYAAVALNEQYTPLGYGTPDQSYVPPTDHAPPKITVLSPTNQTYNKSSILLVYSSDKPLNWTSYSLDKQENITINGNSTITALTSGLHNITVFGNDTFGNIGASQSMTFTIAPEPFPTLPAAAVSSALATVISVGLIVYFKKYRH